MACVSYPAFPVRHGVLGLRDLHGLSSMGYPELPITCRRIRLLRCSLPRDTSNTAARCAGQRALRVRACVWVGRGICAPIRDWWGRRRSKSRRRRPIRLLHRACKHACVHAYAHTYVHALVDVHVFPRIYTHIEAPMYPPTHPHTHTPTHPRTHTRTHTHTVHSGVFGTWCGKEQVCQQ